HILPVERIGSLDRSAPAAADQAAEPAIAAAIDGDGDKLQPAFETELGADEQLQLQQPGCRMRAYHATDGTLVSDGERPVAQHAGTLDELLGVGSPAQKSKVADAMQLGVGRFVRGSGLTRGGVACYNLARDDLAGHPNTPCRNQRWGSARSRNTHSSTPY